MSKIWITTDSTADLTDKLFQDYEIEFVSSGITIGDKFYTDRVDITPDDIYHAVEKLNIFPKTSAGLEEDYRNMFERKTQDGNTVIHISLSRELSAAHDNAKRAAQGMERVYVVDTKTISGAVGLCALIAGDMVKEGKSAEEIVKTLQEDIIPRVHCKFIVDNLKYLHKGGRVSGLKLLGANLLGIRISIKTENGKMLPDKKFRGKLAIATKEFTNSVFETEPDKNICIIVKTDVEKEIITEVEKAVKAQGFNRVYVTSAGCGIVPHGGRGAIGIIFIKAN